MLAQLGSLLQSYSGLRQMSAAQARGREREKQRYMESERETEVGPVMVG